MNTKYFLIALILLIIIIGSYLSAENPDSTKTLLFCLPVPMGQYKTLVDSSVITTQTEYDSVISAMKEKHKWINTEPRHVNFDEFSLVYNSSWADGSAIFSYQVLKDTLAQSIEVHIIGHYGGGRGMDLFNHWLLIPKIPEGYSVKFIHTEGEPRHRYED
ncbi:MAG: hypothetical protein B1H05_00160 [Candidatus Cloacimonas sp. 4484_140]|nr:MAG: hypothetical protein B1H05_00160 [Candidatus Cloacimonas sp. 4484_140]